MLEEEQCKTKKRNCSCMWPHANMPHGAPWQSSACMRIVLLARGHMVRSCDWSERYRDAVLYPLCKCVHDNRQREHSPAVRLSSLSIVQVCVCHREHSPAVWLSSLSIVQVCVSGNCHREHSPAARLSIYIYMHLRT